MGKKCECCGEEFSHAPRHPSQRFCSERCQKTALRRSNPERSRKYTRTYQARHPERAKDAAARWRQSNPGWWRKYAGTPQRREQQAAYHQEHRAERREQRRARYAENPEKHIQWSRAYQAKKAGAYTEPVDYAAVVVRDRGLCGVCHRRVKRVEQGFDHIVPISLGGAHTEANIQLTHRVCNSRRGAGRIPAQLPLPL
jgi:5-methylcytosine-specific restriction endonuclease McrA